MLGFLYYHVLLLLLLLLVYVTRKLVILVWLKPKEIQKQFLDQGISGPRYQPIIGSLGALAEINSEAKCAALPPPPTETNPQHDTLRLVFPHLHIWRKKYGRVCLYWYGLSPRLSITDPKLIKEVTVNPRKYDQCIPHPLVYNLLGTSLVASGGDVWATKRRLLGPLFLVEYLKKQSGLAHHAVENKLETWHKLMDGSDEVEIDVQKEFQSLALHILTTVIFGEDINEGLHIARLQSEQSALSSQAVKKFYIPGSRFLPTKSNRRSKWLRKEVEKKFKEIVITREQRREQQDTDWLGFLLSSESMTRETVLEECCALVIGGSESTSLLMTWACLLMSIHTKWQDKAREEIHQVLKAKGRDSQPTIEILAHLKILNMIINETLRLYPPVPYVTKKSKEEITVQGLKIPSGTEVEVPIIGVHHDPEQWGDNADQFDPDRFSEGISKASKHPMAFMPFMQGPRVCIGSNFGLMEARMALAMILNNFRLNISPNYKHAPGYGISLKPGSGAQILFTKI